MQRACELDNVCFIKISSKLSSVLLLCLLRIFMKQTLREWGPQIKLHFVCRNSIKALAETIVSQIILPCKVLKMKFWEHMK
jgi:hypothetical protein